jgi:hypothetical protein
VATVEELTRRLDFHPCIAGYGQVIVAKFDRQSIESFLLATMTGP